MTAARNKAVGGKIGSYMIPIDPTTGDEIAGIGADGLTSVDVTIADGASLSAAVDIGAGLTIVAIRTPAGWATAPLSFQHALTLVGTYLEYSNLVTGAAVVTGSLAASGSYAADPVDFLGLRFIKIRSGTVAAAVAQAGGDVLTLVVRAV